MKDYDSCIYAVETSSFKIIVALFFFLAIKDFFAKFTHVSVYSRYNSAKITPLNLCAMLSVAFNTPYFSLHLSRDV